jgi:hypothetical protein
MGDRANVAVVQYGKSDEMVYLYSHWGGSELPFTVQKALAKRWRWDDGAYLTRIIFDVMTDGQHGTETSFGISTSRQGNEYSIIVVDPKKQSIGFAHEGAEPNCYETWKFEEYISLPKKVIEKSYRDGK